MWAGCSAARYHGGSLRSDRQQLGSSTSSHEARDSRGSTQNSTSPAETTVRSDVRSTAAMAPASTSSRDVRALRRLKLFNGHLNTPRILSETGPHEVSLLTAKHARCGAEPLRPRRHGHGASIGPGCGAAACRPSARRPDWFLAARGEVAKKQPRPFHRSRVTAVKVTLYRLRRKRHAWPLRRRFSVTIIVTRLRDIW